MIDIKQAARFAIHNKGHLHSVQTCGCFHCCSVFPVAEVTEWTDGGDTALCPRCGVDAVVGQITVEELHRVRAFWCSR